MQASENREPRQFFSTRPFEAMPETGLSHEYLFVPARAFDRLRREGWTGGSIPLSRSPGRTVAGSVRHRCPGRSSRALGRQGASLDREVEPVSRRPMRPGKRVADVMSPVRTAFGEVTQHGSAGSSVLGPGRQSQGRARDDRSAPRETKEAGRAVRGPLILVRNGRGRP